LYAQKTQLGVGILKPSTILTILSLKLYLGHRRNNNYIAKQISINERNAMFEYGHNNSILKVDSRVKPDKIIWSNEIVDRLLKQKIELINTNQLQYVETKNKAIMDLAIEYVQSNRLSEKIIALINHVRLYKKIILPCELVGLIGDKATKCLRNELE